MANTHDLFNLQGKCALVTGGTGWLGTAFAQALAEFGCTVIIAGRDQNNCQAGADKLAADTGRKHFGVALDQMDEASIYSGFSEGVSQAGCIDILINNGLESIGKDLTNITFAEFSRHQINNAGYFELARLLHDHVVDRGKPGSIINIGSIYGQVASYPDTYDGICIASPVAYHVLKGGVIQMTRHLAAYWAKEEVRVNSLSPGPFPNPNSAPQELIERLKLKCPMGRLGHPQDLKGAIVLLASEAGAFLTGQNLTIDGGWTAW
jgi:NAD(P)-dependent dehydrogenase (short-subunit alcohol dehydrogenase family)